MTHKNLIPWCGLATLLGGVLLLVLSIVELVAFRDTPLSEATATGIWVPENILYLIGTALITLGLVGLYAIQAEQIGVLGLIAFLVAFAGMLLSFAFTWAATFLLPVLGGETLAAIEENPPGLLIAGFLPAIVFLDLGWLLFGVASLRAGVFPRGAAVLITIGAVLDFVIKFLDIPAALSGILLIAAVTWMGFALWSAKPMSSGQADLAANAQASRFSRRKI